MEYSQRVKKPKRPGGARTQGGVHKKDMTQLERQREAELRQALKEKREAEQQSGGNARWTIWRGKVVKLKADD